MSLKSGFLVSHFKTIRLSLIHSSILSASAHCQVPKPLLHVFVTALPTSRDPNLHLSSRGNYSNVFKEYNFFVWSLSTKLYSCFMSIHFYFPKWYYFLYIFLFLTLFNHHYVSRPRHVFIWTSNQLLPTVCSTPWVIVFPIFFPSSPLVTGAQMPPTSCHHHR